GTKAFTKEIVANLGRAPKSYPKREYKRLKMPSVSKVPDFVKADRRRVMGVDVFVESVEAPEKLGPLVENAIDGLGVRLKQISNRGAKVYPNQLGIDADPSDCLRLRFQSSRPGEPVKDSTIMEVLTRVTGCAPWVHVEKLSEYDGKLAFTKDQGED
ncbi:MAG: isocitrate dehydrogenase, partial [Elusimicrobia bacterium]|nr:isocitrate dehydrogenase [Elusimicrobiota bacterium]